MSLVESAKVSGKKTLAEAAGLGFTQTTATSTKQPRIILIVLLLD